MAQTQTAAPVRREQRAQRKSLGASTAGQVLEWYEWSAYAVFAPFIAQVMFNPANPVSALLSTLAVFAVGFLVRPLGGVVFGHIADRKGRKFVLITTMMTMAVASVAIGLLPTYSSVGIWASVLLLLLRIVQGFAHGGESAAANSYVAEIAPRHRRGQWGSVVFIAIFGGSVLAYTVGGTITFNAEESFVLEWGWRIPFWLGAILAVVALYMRMGMAESATFEELTEEKISPDDIIDESVETGDPRVVEAVRPKSPLIAILVIIAMVSGVTSAHYTWTSYVSTYAIVEQGMDANSAYWVTVAAQVVALAALPLWGMLSDRIGRKPVLYTFGVGMALMQFPLMGLISDRPWTLLVASMIALLIVGAAGALLACVMSEVFPTAQRTRNIGLAYSLSVAVFGGFAPYLNQLFNSWDMNWMSNGYVVLLCLVTLVAVKILPETKGIDLNAVR
ncbi:MFS transporter [Nesterenkonia natronophila]|uniref:MFS transporter n=1 Tax=Nesterenkonia natronophila TaxID=2174932 RepID=A0A3A4G2S3_9MICC|nr:MFS transporter [Nesterenkonia natronophila]RJN32489.1 MFS transporter [Nesterenkonia natronophila]